MTQWTQRPNRRTRRADPTDDHGGDKMDVMSVEIPKDLARLLRIREKDLPKSVKEQLNNFTILAKVLIWKK